jgi:hypothetical protein
MGLYKETIIVFVTDIFHITYFKQLLLVLTHPPVLLTGFGKCSNIPLDECVNERKTYARERKDNHAEAKA